MATVSLCMIVKNEEAVLARCLDSARSVADEIIIVDTGSSDATKEIARRYTDKVYDFEWCDDFSAARNFAYSKASMDYQMWLDADDVIPPEETTKIIELKRILTDATDMVTMKYHTHFDADGKPILTSTRERLTRRARNYKWLEPVHECIPLSGRIMYSDIAISHCKAAVTDVPSVRNLRIYEGLESRGAHLNPRQLYYFARELKDHGQWAKSAYYFERFLDCGEGWVEDNIGACFELANCYNALGDSKKALPVLLRSFEFDSPRAEICCQIGYYFKSAKNYQVALDWFKLATNLGAPRSVGFVLNDYHGFVPNIEACVCCCELGRFEEAAAFNEAAAGFKPDSEAVRWNRRYLKEKLVLKCN